jgi:hypothetical protein
MTTPRTWPKLLGSTGCEKYYGSAPLDGKGPPAEAAKLDKMSAL